MAPASAIRAGDGKRPRDVGADSGQRFREDGTIIPRNTFVGEPVHRVDLRLQQRIPLAGRVSVDGIFEVFNLFDRANFGSYALDESAPHFLQPVQNANLAYAPAHAAAGIQGDFLKLASRKLEVQSGKVSLEVGDLLRHLLSTLHFPLFTFGLAYVSVVPAAFSNSPQHFVPSRSFQLA